MNTTKSKNDITEYKKQLVTLQKENTFLKKENKRLKGRITRLEKKLKTITSQKDKQITKLKQKIKLIQNDGKSTQETTIRLGLTREENQAVRINKSTQIKMVPTESYKMDCNYDNSRPVGRAYNKIERSILDVIGDRPENKAHYWWLETTYRPGDDGWSDIVNQIDLNNGMFQHAIFDIQLPNAEEWEDGDQIDLDGDGEPEGDYIGDDEDGNPQFDTTGDGKPNLKIKDNKLYNDFNGNGNFGDTGDFYIDFDDTSKIHIIVAVVDGNPVIAAIDGSKLGSLEHKNGISYFYWLDGSITAVYQVKGRS